MNRPIWKQPITEHSAPGWPCPSCGSGTLRLDRSSLRFHETNESKKMDRSECFPGDICFGFTAWVQCDQKRCSEHASVSGTGWLEQDWSGNEEETDWFRRFYPRSIFPMPDVFPIPKTCPKAVADELRAAFVLMWTDRAASANRVRVASERLMDHLKVQRLRKNKKGRFDKLNLHQRIEVFRVSNPEAAKLLMAMKLLGNTGSHERDLSLDDVLDGFEVFEHILAELVGNRTKRVVTLANDLITRHRPGRKRGNMDLFSRL